MNIALLVALLCASASATADDTVHDTVGSGWVALPGLWFNSEQGVGVSALALHYFPLEAEAERPSEVSLVGLATTEGDAAVRVEPSLHLGHGLYRIDTRVELARRVSSFYGIGNDSELAAQERYRRTRFSGRAELTRRLRPDLYLGPALEGFWNSDVASDTEMLPALMSGDILGADSGSVIGAGMIARYDTRNRSYAPSLGALLEGSLFVYDRALGSDYGFAATTANARVYFEPHSGHVVALQARGDFRAGEVPFENLAKAGDGNLLRGLRSGRFRDTHFVGSQIEYRSPMVWRVGAALFAATGRVGADLGELFDAGWKVAGGGGLRFAVKRADRLHLRVDVGVAEDGYQLYIDVREAF
ncbi:hypothetical protein Hoch_5327 [Haliangium ochraceum DSM 14365]|uniref:Bacterial surface antigen (D15) domain-containing protein n=2 Tax=Haliangium ochraceum TaxID=80816 RepID=D0LXQ7_HALO1|nr:hypothetical protein Hoch_5327 [Haliangium ochraceum DSM 14365]